MTKQIFTVGSPGLAPAPAAGDAAAGKFLKADRTFAVPQGVAPSSSWLADSKAYFSDQGLLPANIIKESFSSFPVPDFTNIDATGSFTRLRSRARVVQTGGSSVYNTAGWNLGANYSKVLFIIGGLWSGAANIGGLWISDTQPVVTNSFGNNPADFIMSGGSWSLVGGGVNVTGALWPSNGANQPSDKAYGGLGCFGLYYSVADNLIIGLYKIGDGQWVSVFEGAPSGLTAFHYAGIAAKFTTVGSDGRPDFYWSTPLGIYAA
jgi:hypothetical protein